MSTFKKQTELDAAYKSGKIDKREYHINYRELKPLLDAADDSLWLIRDADMANHMNQLDRERGINASNNYKDIFKEDLQNKAIGYVLVAAMVNSPLIAKTAISTMATTARIGVHGAAMLYRAGKYIIKNPMPTTVGGNAIFALGINGMYDYLKDCSKNDITEQEQKLAFDLAINHSSLSQADKEHFTTLYHQQRELTIRNHGEVMNKFKVLVKEIMDTNTSIGNIETSVVDIKKNILAEQKAKREAAKWQQKIDASQNTLQVLSFIAAKIDPKLGRVVNSIGNVAINVVSKVVAAAGAITFGLAVGVTAALLPIISLFSDDDDIAQHRHEEIMEGIRTIINAIVVIQKEMHERFDLIHQHLSSIENKIDSGFYRTLLNLKETKIQLENIADRLTMQTDLLKNEFRGLRQEINNLVQIVYTLETARYKNELQEAENLLDLCLVTRDYISIANKFNSIYTYATYTAQSAAFIGVVKPNSVFDVDGKSVLNYMNYLQSLTNEEKLPNLYEFRDAINLLICYDVLFKELPNITVINRLDDIRAEIVRIERVLKNMTQKKLVIQKCNDYRNRFIQVVELLVQKMLEKEMQYLGGSSIPILRSAITEYEPTLYVYTITPLEEILPQLPIVVFKHQERHSITGLQKENNIFDVLNQIGVLTYQYEQKLTDDELKKHNLTHIQFARWVTVTFLGASRHGVNFPIGEFRCVALPTFEQDKVVYCLDISEIQPCLQTVLNTPVYENRSKVLFNKSLQELNFVQIMYLLLDAVLYRTKKRIAQEVLIELWNHSCIQSFEQSAVDFLCLYTLNRVCTNPNSVLSQIDTYDFTTVKATLDDGYRISYSNELYTLADMVHFIQQIDEFTDSTEEESPTSSFIDYVKKHLTNSIETFIQPIIEGLGEPETYCCPPILQQIKINLG